MTPRGWPEQRAVDVADGVVAVIHGNGEAGVSNAGLVVDDTNAPERTALVVDTMMFPAMANGLRDELTRRGARPRVVVNTHPHIDHVGGNAAFADVPVVAHPVVGETVRATGLPVAIFDAFMPAFRGEFEKLGRLEPPAPVAGSDVDELRLPKRAELRSYVPAHTPADTVVWLPDDRVLFTGDLCFFGVSPLAIQGLVSAWVAALDDLIGLDPDVVVPGHGPVGTTTDIAAVRDHLTTLLEVGRAAVEAGASIDDAYAELDAGPVGEWIEAERIKPNLERAMQEARGDIDADRLETLPPSAFALLHH